MSRDLYFCGDIHGNIRELVWNLSKRYEIRNSDIIVLGDFGIGFDNTFEDTYKHIESKLDNIDDTIYTIRGNHDDPSFFSKEYVEQDKYKRVKFLEDHKLYNINGRDIYTIGGANSVDIVDRLKNNEYLQKRGKNLCWWPEESVVEKYKGLPIKADIIISHTAPLSFLPVPERFNELPIEQYEKILKERHYLDHVLKEINADYWFYGHFHKSYSGTYGQLFWRCLDIMELYLAPEKINKNPQNYI